MDKGINVITNEGLGFKLINSISFGESVFSTGFIQKTAKEDLIVEGNYGIPPRYPRGKSLEGSRRQTTEAGLDPIPCGAGRPIGGMLRPCGPHLSACFICRIPTAFEDASKSLVKSV